MSSRVYFIKNISSDNLVKIYDYLEQKLQGKVAVKISSGEPGGHNFLKPELIQKLVQKVDGTIVECNTAYSGRRNTKEEHLKVMEEHGFTRIAPVDILDGDGEIKIPVKSGKHLQYDIVGKNLDNYDYLINLAHFKGHAMGGFGGVLKNQSIGIASRNGKAYIHSVGITDDPNKCWNHIDNQNGFLESMAEAAKAVSDYFLFQGKKIIYIDIMNNLSVDCDCDANPDNPCMQDIGILASMDPVSLDQACIDLIWNSSDPGKSTFIERVERQNGRHILEYAEEIGLGTRDYELIEIK